MKEVEESILQYFIDHATHEVEYADIRFEMVRRYDLPTFLNALSRLCVREILYQINNVVHINDIYLFIKSVLRLKYRVSAAMLCLFIFAYKRKILEKEEVIIDLKKIIRLWNYTQHCQVLLLTNNSIRRNAIYELSKRGFLEVLDYKLYKFNYENIDKRLIKIILEVVSLYTEKELQKLFS